MNEPQEVREIPKHLQEEHLQLFDHDKYEYRWVKVDGVTRGDLFPCKPGEAMHSVMVMQRKLKV